MKKKLIIFIMTLIFMTSCSKKQPDISSNISSDIQTETSQTTIPTVSETVTDISTDVDIYDFSVEKGINIITGLSDYNVSAYNKRPVAVMVNNVKASLPQYGISQADAIYEIPVEAGITRLMAVYADYTAVPDVCSIRSCRYYFPVIAYGMDAFYCCWGSDETIGAETLSRLGIDFFDGKSGGSLFERDYDRLNSYSMEHTGVFKGSLFAEYIQSSSIRDELLEENKKTLFCFTDTPYSVSDTPCQKVKAVFSEAYYSDFVYDTSMALYMKYHSGVSHTDGKTGEQLGFKNLFLLQTDISVRDDAGRIDVSLDSGKGFYISNGAVKEILWSKPSENENILITDTDGKTVKVNRGKSYIGFLGTDDKIIFG